MATHSSVLAWRIPGTGKPGGLPSVGSHSQTRLQRLTRLNSIRCLDNYLNMKIYIVNRSSAAAAAKSLQSCPTLCDPIDGSPPGSSVPGILQARVLEWVAISFSNA